MLIAGCTDTVVYILVLKPLLLLPSVSCSFSPSNIPPDHTYARNASKAANNPVVTNDGSSAAPAALLLDEDDPELEVVDEPLEPIGVVSPFVQLTSPLAICLSWSV